MAVDRCDRARTKEGERKYRWLNKCGLYSYRPHFAFIFSKCVCVFASQRVCHCCFLSLLFLFCLNCPTIFLCTNCLIPFFLFFFRVRYVRGKTHTRFLLYLHFTQVAGKCTIKKNNDDQIARSRSVQAIQFVSVLMMLREFLVSWQLNFIFYQYANYEENQFYFSNSSSQLWILYNSGKIFTSFLFKLCSRQKEWKYRDCFSWHLDCFFWVVSIVVRCWLTWTNSNSSPSLTPGILVLPWHIVGYVEMCVPNKHSSKLVHIPITNIANISGKMKTELVCFSSFFLWKCFNLLEICLFWCVWCSNQSHS